LRPDGKNNICPICFDNFAIIPKKNEKCGPKSCLSMHEFPGLQYEFFNVVEGRSDFELSVNDGTLFSQTRGEDTYKSLEVAMEVLLKDLEWLDD